MHAYIHILLNELTPLGAALKNHRLSRKKTQVPPFQLLVRVVQKIPKMILVIVFGCLSEVESKSLLWRTLSASDTGPRGFESDLT